MAEGKKKFVVYADWLHSLEDLTDDEVGKLMRHMFEYVNDLNPVLEDRILKVAWKPMQATLKRDLEKWEDKSISRKEKARKAGIASAIARKNKKELKLTNELNNQLDPTKSTDSVSVSVIDSVSVSDNGTLNQSEGKENEIIDLDKSPVKELLTEKITDRLKKEFSSIENFDQLIDSACMTIESEGKWKGQDEGWFYRRIKKWLTSYSLNRIKRNTQPVKRSEQHLGKQYDRSMYDEDQ